MSVAQVFIVYLFPALFLVED